MFINFAMNLYKNLIENNFISIVNNFTDSELTENTKFISVYKQIGSVVYIVNILNINKITLELYEQQSNEYKSYILPRLENLNCEHIIMLDLMISDNVTEELISYTSKEEFIPEESFHIIEWIVDLDNNKIISSKTNKILNIDELINLSLNNTEIIENNHTLQELQNTIIKNSTLKPKSKNLYLMFSILFINLVIWLLIYIYNKPVTVGTLLKYGANSPYNVFIQKEYFRLFTSIFLHADISHLLFNSFSLYLFGNKVEKYFGKLIFLVIYIISGIISSLISVLFTQSVSVGASGAIYGLLGSLIALIHQTGKDVEGFSLYLVVSIAIIGISLGFLNPLIDNYAHIAGVVSGYIIGFILCPEEKNTH